MEKEANSALDKLKQKIARRLDQHFELAATGSTNSHLAFLKQRSASIKEMAALIEGQAAALAGKGTSSIQVPAVYSYSQLNEFAEGDPVRCLGKDFEVFTGRRIPRIPNGDLLLMSRIIKVDGTRLDFREGSSLVAEYDVPVDAWYLRDNSYPDIPISVWMEIALQPCGMLLAHLSPILLHPQQEYIFRNLDGEARLLDRIDVRAKTITTRVVLLKTIISGNMFIHTLSFALNCGGVPLFEGSSTFGFFPPESLAAQTGLDGGKETSPSFLMPGGSRLEGEAVKASSYRLPPVGNPFWRLPEGKMDLIEDAYFASKGGRYGKGYIFARRTNDPSSWFFRNHFFQDPVMPGSLGVEAIYQSMQAYLLNQNMGKNMVMPRFDLVNRETLVWKYRGQILPVTKEMQIEAHIVDLQELQDGVVLIADASIWGDSIRIYDVKRAAIRLVEG